MADPSRGNRVEANERAIAAYTNRTQSRGGKQITIPVVVHLMSPSVTDAQVVSQIDALNRDYNKLNTDATNIPAEFTNFNWQRGHLKMTRQMVSCVIHRVVLNGADKMR